MTELSRIFSCPKMRRDCEAMAREEVPEGLNDRIIEKLKEPKERE